MKLKVDMFVMGSSLLMAKFNFVFIKFVILNSDIYLKFNKGLDKFRKVSNWYPHRLMDIFDVKELKAGMMKYGVWMEHPLWRMLTNREGTFIVSVYPGFLDSTGCFVSWP